MCGYSLRLILPALSLHFFTPRLYVLPMGAGDGSLSNDDSRFFHNEMHTPSGSNQRIGTLKQKALFWKQSCSKRREVCIAPAATSTLTPGFLSLAL